MGVTRNQKVHPIKITEAAYKDVGSLVLESDALRVAIIPAYGSKMASLMHKRTGVEHLYQLPGKTFRRAAYGDSFEKGESSGFDEMFPTITACYCDTSPWAGTLMPDHGEVWSIPWQFEVKETAVRLSVHGVRFPYVLSKEISFESANTVRLQYFVENPTHYAFPAMWAAHPLFNAHPGARIILPEAVREIMNTVPGPALGEYGSRLGFPTARTQEGKEWDLSRMGPDEGKYYFKYFCLDKLREGFAIIHDPKSRETTALAWPVDQIPYLGMWVNEGAWEGQFNVAPEPCTAPFDRWDVARQWGKLPVVPAFGRLQWELRLTIDLADDPHRVLSNGTIE
jgi:galactose mutarotase-like enzyme